MDEILIKLVIENFGPIEKADIEVGDFTAIIGPNSSGKTFILKIVDGIMKVVSNLFFIIIPNTVFKAVEEILVKKENKYPTRINLSNYPEEILNQIVDFVLQNLTKRDSQLESNLQNSYAQLLRSFQASPKNLIKFGKDHAKINARFEQVEISIIISSNKEQPDVEFTVNREFIKKFVREFEANYVYKNSGSYNSRLPIQQFNSVLIPAERLSILATMPNILDDLARSLGFQFLHFPPMQMTLEQEDRQPNISPIEFMSNYFKAIQLLNITKKQISTNASNLIMGDLNLDPKLPFFINYIIGDNRVPVQLISSGTLQLIPLIVIAESNFAKSLLIEEPEINLHANKQVEVAEYLWKLIEERKNNILVSTHSDYFVIKLAHLSKTSKNKTLKIYLLNEGRTKILNIDENGEIDEIETIGKVINNLLLEV